MCSDPSKMEMKSLWERFPLGKNCNRSSRIRFVLFLTSGDESIALKISMFYLVRNYSGNNLQASYSAGSCFDGQKIMAYYV